MSRPGCDPSSEPECDVDPPSGRSPSAAGRSKRPAPNPEAAGAVTEPAVPPTRAEAPVPAWAPGAAAAAGIAARAGATNPLKRPAKNSALREFLTLRRALILPASVGLKSTKSRRSAGLTREDMAELTGVSFKWYTLFESGAAKGVSRKFAERVVTVLGLSPAERHFLLGLMGFADAGTGLAMPPQVPPPLMELVDALEGVAAALVSPLMDTLHANARYRQLFPAPLAGAAHGRNHVWRLFMDPAFRSIWLDWEGAATGMLADFRYTSAALRHTPEFVSLMDALSGNPDFRRTWADEASARIRPLGGRYEVRLPGGERAMLQSTLLQAAAAPGMHLITWARVSSLR